MKEENRRGKEKEGKREGDTKKAAVVMAVVIVLSQSSKTQLRAPTSLYSKSGPCTSSIDIARKFVKNADSRAPLHAESRGSSAP